MFTLKKILTILFLFSLSLCQFRDINITYEHNENTISDNKLYILDEFVSKVEKYFRSTNFSYEFGYIDIPIKVHFIFENINFTGPNTYNSISCHFLISNNYDLYYYTKSTQLLYDKGKEFYLNELNFDPLTSIFDYFAFLFIAYELDGQELFLGDSYYSKCLEISSNGLTSKYASGWDNRHEEVKSIKNNEYLRLARNLFYSSMNKFYNEKYNTDLLTEMASDLLFNLQSIHNKIGYDKNTLKFINSFYIELTELFHSLNMEKGIIFLYNFDDKNQSYYEKYFD